MLDPHTEHATHLRNHWYWRPGHRPGRPFYTWHLTFENQQDLHRLVREYQQEALADVPALDLVPVPWLHITMQGIGFADEVPDTDRDAIIKAASQRLAMIPAATVSFHRVTIRPEAITLYPRPAEPIHTIRSEIRDAIANVWGVDQVSDPTSDYQPHLSIAYANEQLESSNVGKLVSALNVEAASINLRSASCIALTRTNHLYRWVTRETAPLAV